MKWLPYLWKFIDFLRSLLKAGERAKSEEKAKETRAEVEDENRKLSDAEKRKKLSEWTRG